MATGTITHTVTDPSGTSVGADHEVEAMLFPTAGFRISDSTGVARRETTTTAADGSFSLTLENNSNISPPTNSFWIVTINLPPSLGGAQVWPIQVNGNSTLLAALINPAASSGMESYLTQAAGDARYAPIGSANDIFVVFDDIAGASNDGVTDNFASWVIARALVRAAGGGTIFFGPGDWYFSAGLRIDRNMTLRGSGGGWQRTAGAGQTGPATELLFADAVTGITVERAATSEDGGPGDGSIIENLGLRAAASTSATAHGIDLKARANVRNVHITSFGGNGVNIDSTTAGANANNFRLETMRIVSCDGHGVYTDGSDSNNGIGINVDASSNGGWGIYDSSFLGCRWFACHTNGNTLGGFTNTGGSRAEFFGCYEEHNQPESHVIGPGLVFGGNLILDATSDCLMIQGGTSGSQFISGVDTTKLLTGRVQAETRERWSITALGKLTYLDGSATTVRGTLELKLNNVLGIGAGDCWRTGVVTTGGRPSAATVGEGSQIFDSTLNQPIWSDGANWVDATGAAV